MARQPNLSDAARALGRKGGRVGGLATGARKKRSPEHYAAMQARAIHVRRVTAARRMLDEATRPDDYSMLWFQIRDNWGEDVLRDALREE